LRACGGRADRAQPVEYGNAIVAADYDLSVDETGATSENRDGSGNGWIAGGPIDSATGQETHASAVTSRQRAKAVELNFMNPMVPSGRVWCWAGEARCDEAR